LKNINATLKAATCQ